MTNTAPRLPDAGVAITGSVFGGQQPVGGAAIYLFAVNTTGYGNPSVSLLNSSVLTNNPGMAGVDGNGDYYVVSGANGSFSIPNVWTGSSSSATVTKWVGVAPPTITPMAVQLPVTPTADGSSYIGFRP